MFQDLLVSLHSLVSGLEPWQQLLALVPAGAIPFIESYLGSFLGTSLGIPPLLAIPAAVVGNLLSTFAVVALSGRAREAATARRGRRTETVGAARQPSRFRQKVAAALAKYGVPGVCLLGPLVVASQLSGPALVALGAARRTVYLWMGISIIAWGVLFGAFGSLFLSAIV
ncbi:hypothetical protein Bfae_03400 [Brachybacterium faecium DSM 4810]|uniref:Small multidrug efflux protein n=1 Tax=Brachybacterium faecium (strain ATCC 43885 / DSM 4810 / JCM 11609 / LMG 19847 / NBRC 14762 / NCIMB 9860 / 6-10) TaxID=446465 RepID=C7MGM5_BRAFD|nr:hypothetical protein [Brachybacterium faecium]ACU84216.1 hypothetical protein Bfae_03400 [Brachybacterium faecium DSM 4810]